MLQYCSVSIKKRVQLQMCYNLCGLVWCQCGRIWKMWLPLRWKMRTPLYVTYPQYLDCFAKYSIAWSTTFTNHVSFLITLFYFRFACFFLGFSHVQIRELTFAASCILFTVTIGLNSNMLYSKIHPFHPIRIGSRFQTLKIL